MITMILKEKKEEEKRLLMTALHLAPFFFKTVRMLEKGVNMESETYEIHSSRADSLQQPTGSNLRGTVN